MGEDTDALLFAPDAADDLARQALRMLTDAALAEKRATNAAARVGQVVDARQKYKQTTVAGRPPSSVLFETYGLPKSIV